MRFDLIEQRLELNAVAEVTPQDGVGLRSPNREDRLLEILGADDGTLTPEHGAP